MLCRFVRAADGVRQGGQVPPPPQKKKLSVATALFVLMERETAKRYHQGLAIWTFNYLFLRALVLGYNSIINYGARAFTVWSNKHCVLFVRQDNSGRVEDSVLLYPASRDL